MATIDLGADDPASLAPVSSSRVGVMPVRNSFDHLVGRRRGSGAVLPENASRANLIGSNEPTVAADIGRQYRSEPAFGPVVSRSGHRAALWRHPTPSIGRSAGFRTAQVSFS